MSARQRRSSVPESSSGTATVSRGDSLTSIAAAELGDGNRWREIYDLNRQTIGRNPNNLQPGMTLVLPGSTPTLDAAASEAGMGIEGTSWSEEPATSGPRRITVAPGEWLGSIASKYLGDSERWREIYEMNRDAIGRNPNRIRPGTMLVLPEAAPAIPIPVPRPSDLVTEAPTPPEAAPTVPAATAPATTAPATTAPATTAPATTAPATTAPVVTAPVPATTTPATTTPATTTPTTTTPTTTTPTTTTPAATANTGLQPWVEPIALASATASAVAVCPADLRAYGSQNIPLLLRNAANARVTLPDQAAYILATAEHESGFGRPRYSRSTSLVEDSNPFRQARDGSWNARVHTNGRQATGATPEELEIDYWDTAYGGRLGNRAGTTDGANYRGRGFAQLTGRTNYESMSRILNSVGYTYTLDGTTYGTGGVPIDLVANPDHVNRVPDLAARILVEGSMRGTFTGRGLNSYITEENTDFVNARRVINGTDRAEDIAAIANRYAAALRGARVWEAVFMPINAPARA